MVLKYVQKAFRNRRRIELKPGIEVREKIIAKQLNVLATVAQIRHMKMDHIYSIEQICSELAAPNGLLQSAIRRADQPRLHVLNFLIAEPRKLTVLQKMQ